tara:strand:- start:1375 stop:1977 length:603 start_codon:yes stop_codon:yes gene_type:complete
MPIKAKFIPLLILIASALAIYTILVIQEFDTALLDLFLRSTGIVSFLLFTLSFGISAIHYVFKDPITKRILRRRKAFGLTFAGFFAIHFSLIGVKSVILGDRFNADPSLETILVVFAVLIMSITSIPSVIKKLGASKWKAIHLICGFYIALGLIKFYIMSLNRIDHALLFLIIMFSVLTLKLVMHMHRAYLKRKGVYTKK